MASLDGQRVVITGGSKGIGRACVFQALQRNVAIVITCARTYTDLQQLTEDVSTQLGNDKASKLVVVNADVSTPDGRQSLQHAVRDNVKQLDKVVLQAGTNKRKRSEQYESNEFFSLVSDNMASPFFTAQTLYPFLASSSESDASIVLMSSVAASTAIGTGAPYAMCKSSCRMLAQYLSCEWPNVRVNAVSPGFIHTPLTQSRLDSEDTTFLSNLRSHTPMQRYGVPDEVAQPIMFLLSSNASFITGTNLTIDGGLSSSSFWAQE